MATAKQTTATPKGMKPGDTVEIFNLRVALGALRRGEGVDPKIAEAIKIVEAILNPPAK